MGDIQMQGFLAAVAKEPFGGPVKGGDSTIQGVGINNIVGIFKQFPESFLAGA